jgi:hypothetical protein
MRRRSSPSRTCAATTARTRTISADTA